MLRTLFSRVMDAIAVFIGQVRFFWINFSYFDFVQVMVVLFQNRGTVLVAKAFPLCQKWRKVAEPTPAFLRSDWLIEWRSGGVAIPGCTQSDGVDLADSQVASTSAVDTVNHSNNEHLHLASSTRVGHGYSNGTADTNAIAHS